MPAMDELGFEGVGEALHRGIVIAVAFAAHRGLETGRLEHLAVILRGILLNAPIGMVEQAGARPMRSDGHLQCGQRQVGAQVIVHRPVHDPAAVKIHDYYRAAKPGGLQFPSRDELDHADYWDFVYFSFVIGMTAQVSDVGITDKTIRRTATAHGIISFVFNTALVALMVNIAASAI